MDTYKACPKCKANWVGEKIPPKDRKFYGGDTHFHRGPIGVEYGYPSPEHYDGISEWQCPDCKTRWGRWTHKEIPAGMCESRWGERGLVPAKGKEDGAA